MIVNPGKFIATAVASLTQPLFNKGANLSLIHIYNAVGNKLTKYVSLEDFNLKM